MNSLGDSTTSRALEQAQNPLGIHALSAGPPPRFLHLKIEIDLRRRAWQCYAGAAGSGRYLKPYAGRLLGSVARRGEQQADLYTLNEVSRQAAQRFIGARLVNVSFQTENASAPIARLELGDVGWAA